jgi:hypothetical protein
MGEASGNRIVQPGGQTAGTSVIDASVVTGFRWCPGRVVCRG